MKFHKYIFILLISIWCTGCKKGFLEIVDNTILLKQGYVVNLETTGHFVNGIYTDLAAYYAKGTYLPFPEIAADNLKPTGTIFRPSYFWTLLPEGEDTEFGSPVFMWKIYYKIIRNCNFAIEKAIEFRSENEITADDLQGQALAIRAMLHFTLVNMFAQSYNFTNNGTHIGIPYIVSSDLQTPISRQPVSEVYDNLIKDLTVAIKFLAKSNIVREKMNYRSAKALLARVYLFKEDFENAKKLSLEVLAEVPLMLNNYPDNLYRPAETEALFRMPPGASSPNSYYGQFMGWFGRAASPTYFGTDDIAKLLQEDFNDKRSKWVTSGTSGWLISKFPRSAVGQYPLPDGDHYQVLFRSSEMCLTAAESYAKLNKDDSARFYIDIIRLRANPMVTPLTASGSSLIDTIYKERRKEMCFDGLRMFDLLRWKKGIDRMDALSPSAKNLPYPSNKAICPIPKSDVELSKLPQNLGY